MDYVRRVEQLVALSGSDNENEARSAAFQACRLIRKHGLQIVEKGARHARPDGRWERQHARWEDFDGHGDSGQARARKPRQRMTRGPYVRARHIVGAECAECRERIEPGECFLDAGGVAVHGDCIPAGERP
jgi:hypothetical protein